MLQLEPIPAFNDNYIWCVFSSQSKQAVVVDPGCAKTTLNFLKKNDLELIAILLTHHHADHTGGIKTLRQETNARVYGFENSNFKEIDSKHTENQSFSLLGTTFKLI